MPVEAVNRMTPAEFEGWQHHLVCYPPTEVILAALWLAVSRALGNDKATPADMGRWLESPEQRREREEKEARAKRVARVQATAQAFRNSRSQPDDAKQN